MIVCLLAGLLSARAYEQKSRDRSLISTTERIDTELYKNRRPVRVDRNGLSEERK
jgi:hypothetical protein